MAIRSRKNKPVLPNAESEIGLKTPAEAVEGVVESVAVQADTGDLKKYMLITPYPQVSPQGVRFLPNEPTLHLPGGWIEANVLAGVLKEV